VRQLYHLKVIEAFSGRLKQPKATDGVKPFEVNVDPGLMQVARILLEELNIQPPPVTPSPAEYPEVKLEVKFCLIETNKYKPLLLTSPSPTERAQVKNRI